MSDDAEWLGRWRHGPVAQYETYARLIRMIDAKDARIVNLEAGREIEQTALRNAIGRIAELEALTQPFTQSELARAEDAPEAATCGPIPEDGVEYREWLLAAVQAVAEALVEDREDER